MLCPNSIVFSWQKVQYMKKIKYTILGTYKARMGHAWIKLYSLGLALCSFGLVSINRHIAIIPLLLVPSLLLTFLAFATMYIIHIA